MSSWTKDRLEQAIEHLESALESGERGDGSAWIDWATTVGQALARLEHALRLHLDNERGGRGILSPIDDSSPDLDAQVDGLLREEQDLLELAGYFQGEIHTSLLNMRTQCGLEQEYEIDALRVLGVELIWAIREHRQRERSLLLHLVGADTGPEP